MKVLSIALVICAVACGGSRSGPDGAGSVADVDGGFVADMDSGSVADVDSGSVADVDGGSIAYRGPGVPRGTVATASGAPTCPADHPVLCETQCCAVGTTCADGATPGIDAGSCIAPTSPPVCPADAPVTCSTAPITDPGGGVLAYDESRHGVHARLLAPATFGEGRASPALDLPPVWPDGCRRDVATAPRLKLAAGDQPHSIEAWVRTTGGSGFQGIAGFGGAGLSGSLLATSGGFASFNGCVRTGGGGLAPGAPSNAGAERPLTPGAWHHLVGVYFGSGDAAIYVDGTPVCGSRQAALSLPAGPTVVFGNALAAATCAPFSGQIDEVRIVSRALSAAEISADFAAARHPVTADTLGLWRFDEGAPVRCCPAGSTCDPGGRCSAAPGGAAPPCPAGAPVSCGDGSCCPTGTTCSAAGCTVPSSPAGCTAAAPVSCGDGSCCPTGTTCAAGKCIKSPAVTPSVVCGAGEIAVPSGGTSGYVCCPSPRSGEAVTFEFSRCPAMRACRISFSGANCPGGCATGYDCCAGDASNSECVASLRSSGVCTGPACGGDATSAGGCCSASLTCGGSGMCCPAGETTCGTGCCTAGPVPAAVCDGGDTLCSGVCCPGGSTCVNGECVAAVPVGIFCGNGSPCGSVCCPALTVCARPGVCAQPPQGAACGAGFSGACSPVGPCCRDGFVCKGGISNRAGFSCLATGVRVPRGGPAGPACGSGYCESGAFCGGSTCCPADHPGVCGPSCCLEGASCTGGSTCGCNAAFPVVCGARCCADGMSCTAGACTCPADRPLACGDGCCLPGAACSNGVCGCPAGRVACGKGCCSAGQLCQGGACVSAPTDGGGGGACSVSRAECCSSGASLCAVPPATCDDCPTGTRKGVICAAGSPCNTQGGITAGYRICHCQ